MLESSCANWLRTESSHANWLRIKSSRVNWLRTESSRAKWSRTRLLSKKLQSERGWNEGVWGNLQWDLLEEGFPWGVTVRSETEL